MASAARLIVLDGPSCVGKSSVAKALQAACLPQVWLSFSTDTLVYGLPPSVLSDCNQNNDWGQVDVNALMEGTFACVSALLHTGNRVIFDGVISTARRGEAFQHQFSDHHVFYVGLTAPWMILEQRALARQDRTLAVQILAQL